MADGWDTWHQPMSPNKFKLKDKILLDLYEFNRQYIMHMEQPTRQYK